MRTGVAATRDLVVMIGTCRASDPVCESMSPLIRTGRLPGALKAAMSRV